MHGLEHYYRDYMSYVPTDIPDFLVGIDEYCNPVNMTLLVLDNETYISWDTSTSNCSFLVAMWNCLQYRNGNTPSTCNVNESNWLPLSQCFPEGYLFTNGTIINIKWDNKQCREDDSNCASYFYIPELTETG